MSDREALRLQLLDLAHELNNLCTAVLLRCDLLATNPPPATANQLRHLEEIRSVGARGARLATRLLQLSIPEQCDPQTDSDE